MARLSLVPFTTDSAFYGALKVHVFGTIWDTVLQGLRAGRTAPLTASSENGLSVRIGRFTARKANHLFVPSGTNAKHSAEFFGFTSHKVREKLTELSEGGTVELVGRGLRDAQTYHWRETITKHQLCSYLRVRTMTGSDPSLALEVYRAQLAFGNDEFAARDFVDLYRTVHEEEYSTSRWGKRKFQQIADSYQYQQFLKNRLVSMGKAKLIVANKARSTFTLSPRAADVGHHFGLFLEDLPYKASWEMCAPCPARRQCWDLQVTDLVLDAIQGPGANGANGSGSQPAPNGSGSMTNGSGGNG